MIGRLTWSALHVACYDIAFCCCLSVLSCLCVDLRSEPTVVSWQRSFKKCDIGFSTPLHHKTFGPLHVCSHNDNSSVLAKSVQTVECQRTLNTMSCTYSETTPSPHTPQEARFVSKGLEENATEREAGKKANKTKQATKDDRSKGEGTECRVGFT